MLSLDDIKQAALAVGFDDCSVARADALTDDEYPLREWLRQGWHGDLGYMERNVEMRLDPRLLVPGAKSVICCVSAYGPPDPQRTDGVAAYAQHREYHSVVKAMLFALRERLGIDGKVCCDTVPISDKHWAARAGLGWIGRHTLLITPRWGTWVNLGEIVTTEEVESEERRMENGERRTEVGDRCTRCHRCVDACPNHALAPDGPPMLDVRRCTAYYTTHQQRPLPPDVDTRGYTQGCDLCQLACPFNGIVKIHH
ncbi:MAG: DUF1730 domain-containing protein [Bacteroidales bacterium]|nr:DUF1730 domain-containing protein [Bacteroidales bacterium]